MITGYEIELDTGEWKFDRFGLKLKGLNQKGVSEGTEAWVWVGRERDLELKFPPN